MDLTRYMVLNNKGQDITAICNYNQGTGFYDVTYHTGKTYNYKKSSLTILTNPEIIPAEKQKRPEKRLVFIIDAVFFAADGLGALVGQIGVYTGWVNDIAAGTKAAITGFDWAGLILISFVLPALLSLAFHALVKNLGLVKDGDMKL